MKQHIACENACAKDAPVHSIYLRQAVFLAAVCPLSPKAIRINRMSIDG